MFDVGDIVEMFAPTASKTKYHLCVCGMDENRVASFFFINSGTGYAADFVLQDGQISGLPKSPTGLSVISCSIVIRQNERQMKLYKARKIGRLSKKLSSKLSQFVNETPALPKKQREHISKLIASIGDE
jgi:hypothetical protein